MTIALNQKCFSNSTEVSPLQHEKWFFFSYNTFYRNTVEFVEHAINIVFNVPIFLGVIRPWKNSQWGDFQNGDLTNMCKIASQLFVYIPAQKAANVILQACLVTPAWSISYVTCQPNPESNIVLHCRLSLAITNIQPLISILTWLPLLAITNIYTKIWLEYNIHTPAF